MAIGERERITSWKRIAGFIGCDPRTAQRYELQRGLPIHRIPGTGSTTVFAYGDELRAWLDNINEEHLAGAGLTSPAASETHPLEQPPQARLTDAPAAKATTRAGFARPILILTGVIAALILAASSWPRPFWFSTVGISRIPVWLNNGRVPKNPPLLTDGKLIYFQQGVQGKFVMGRIPADGGAVRPWELSLAYPEPEVLHPRGQALLVRNIENNKDGDEPLYIQPLPAGTPTRLGEIRAYGATWTPNGDRIIFSRLQSVFLASTEGKVLRKLFDVPGRAYWFRWHPNGHTLRFTVYNSTAATYQIWQADDLEAPPHRVALGVDDLTQQCCGAWHPDGDAYFFQAFTGGFFQVFVNSAILGGLRSDTRQLTVSPSNSRSPVPTPDGKRLVILNQVENTELAYFDSASERWLPLLEGVPVATVDWSPDRRSIAFTKLPDHTLWRCEMPGCRDPLQLTAPPLRATMPRWSPDGTRIACMTRALGSPWRASLVSADGAKLVTPIQSELAQADPGWSPHGDALVFGSTPNPDTGHDRALHVLDLRANRVSEIPGSRGFHSPRWSPDGKSLFAVRVGSKEVGFYSFLRQTWQTSSFDDRVGYPNWTSDGKAVQLLVGIGTPNARVSLIEASTLRVSTVAPLHSLRRPSFSFGDWIGVDPEGNPLALRDIGSQAVLAWDLERR